MFFNERRNSTAIGGNKCRWGSVATRILVKQKGRIHASILMREGDTPPRIAIPP